MVMENRTVLRSNRFADSAITNAPKTRYVSAVASAGSSSTDVLWAYYSPDAPISI